jgi:hypothetical protein
MRAKKVTVTGRGSDGREEEEHIDFKKRHATHPTSDRALFGGGDVLCDDFGHVGSPARFNGLSVVR